MAATCTTPDTYIRRARRVARWKANPRVGKSSWSANSWRHAKRLPVALLDGPQDGMLDGIEF